MRLVCFYIVQLFAIFSCSGQQLSIEQNERFVNAFVDYLGRFPNHHISEPVLLQIELLEPNLFRIAVRVKSTNPENVEDIKYQNCTFGLSDSKQGATVLYHICTDFEVAATPVQEEPTDSGVPVTEVAEKAPVVLDNEVVNVAPTSGEEFIAVPREKPSPCIGCATHVDPTASGVTELANLGIQQLDRLEPDIRHMLNTVFDVERVVQVVNGVRYILTMSVDYNNCTAEVTETCEFLKICKVSIVEKPWIKLPDGSKHRTIVANNCTEQWIFGDEGEVMGNDRNTQNNDTDTKSATLSPGDSDGSNGSSDNDVLKVVFRPDLQSQIPTEKRLSEEQLRDLEQQIIPNQQIHDNNEEHFNEADQSRIPKDDERVVESHNKKLNSERYFSNSQLIDTDTISSLSEKKRKAIDNLFNFFEFSDLSSNTNVKKIREIKVEPRGAPKEVDSSDPKYKKLALESLEKYLKSNGKTETHKIVQINKVTTQLVAGTLTKILFKASPTNCELDEFGTVIDAVCDSNEHHEYFQCNSQVWVKPWENFKEITVTCKPVVNSRKRRDGFAKSLQLPGGPTEHDVNNPEYKKLAMESLQKYLQSNGKTERHKVVTIDKVNTQVVAGKLTTIDFKMSPTSCELDEFGTVIDSVCDSNEHHEYLQCKSQVWVKPWENFKEITVTCKPVVNSRKRRDGFAKSLQLPGGPTEHDVNNPEYKKLAMESLQKYLQSNGKTERHKVVTIDKVNTQVVAGKLTTIDFKMSPTSCELDEFGTVIDSVCDSNEHHEYLQCKSQVWVKPWENFKEITVTCKPVVNSRKRRDGFGNPLQLVGGPTQQDVNNPKFMTLAMESMQKYLQSNGKTERHKVVMVDKVTTQVVAGKITTIDFKISPTNCELDSFGKATNSKCEDVVAFILECHSVIWEKEWLNFKEINVSCDTGLVRQMTDDERIKVGSQMNSINAKPDQIKHRSKRQLGGQAKADPNDPKWLNMSEISIARFCIKSGLTMFHKVVEVVNVTQQVVSGMLYRLNFKVSRTACPVDCNGNADVKKITSNKDLKNCQPVDASKTINCYSEVWAKDWLGENATQYNVTCDDAIHSKQFKREAIYEDNNEDDIYNKRFKREAIGSKRQLGGPGSPWKGDPNDPKWVNMAEISMAHFCIKNDLKIYNRVVKVVNVSEQIVSGSLHKINFKVSRTSCPVDCNANADVEKVASKKDLKFCQPVDESKTVNCYSEVWEKPWLGPSATDYTVTCDKAILEKKKKREAIYEDNNEVSPFEEKYPRYARTARGIGTRDYKENNDYYNNLAELSLKKHEMQSGATNTYKIININRIYEQVLDGKIIHIHYIATPTTCLIDVNDRDACQPQKPRTLFTCHAEIWSQNEMTVKCKKNKNVKVKLTDDKKNQHGEEKRRVRKMERRVRRKRSLSMNKMNTRNIGSSHMEFDRTETAMTLANVALKFIEAKYPHPRKQKVVNIFSLHRKSTNVLHYKLKLEVGPTNCFALSLSDDCKIDADAGNTKFCRVNIWVRSSDHPLIVRAVCDNLDDASNEINYEIQAEQLFHNFVATHRPHYMNNTEEFRKRYRIFRDNIRKIHELNTHERGTAEYAVTKFTDLTYEEFSANYMGLRQSLRDENLVPMRHAEIPTVDVPTSFDWRDSGAVTEVKDQGSCGSCWAFSVTGNIEGQWKIKTGNLVSLSEQELVDCDAMDQGCNGGLPDNAYRAIEQLGGLETESAYPYEAMQDKCAFKKSLVKVQISGAVNISSNETDMTKWLVQHGPISIGDKWAFKQSLVKVQISGAVNISSNETDTTKWLVHNGPISIGINANAMQFYVGGVSHPWKVLCNPKNLDHGVLIVGYGIKEYPLFNKHLPYWIVKNSWGPGWGEQGYYRVYRGDGTCGVNQMASSAVV